MTTTGGAFQSARRAGGLVALLAAAVFLGGIAKADETSVPQMAAGTQGSAVTIDTANYERVRFIEHNERAFGSDFLTGRRNAAAANANVARSFVVGNDNFVTQNQFGTGNESNVGIINADKNFVGVWQIGNGLQSNVGLVNTQGVGVVVLQGPNASPSNIFALGLPKGGLLIAR